MAEIRCSTQDEYVLNTGEILASLETFSTLFGLKLGYILFVTAELVSKNIQGKDVTVQQALSSVNLATAFTEDKGQKRLLIIL